MNSTYENITIVNVHFCTSAKMTQRRKIITFVVVLRIFYGYFYIIDNVYFVADNMDNGLYVFL